eukprot:GEMP01026436.1.p1 GENE.GEMP01026436.1~~GEMP01026436.1.p1  ORF type:complete len:388 (+),score=95.55 GEMP01026436.1:56-1219(+)
MRRFALPTASLPTSGDEPWGPRKITEGCLSLEYANLTTSQLDAIFPRSCAPLQQVTTLILSHNRLTILDRSLSSNRLPKLEDLRVNANLLQEVPALDQLTTLVKLSLSYNRLTDASFKTAHFGSMESLRHLDVSFNLITSIPSVVGSASWPYLDTLSFEGNQLAATELPALPRLKTLNLGSNLLEDVRCLSGVKPNSVVNLDICDCPWNAVEDWAESLRLFTMGLCKAFPQLISLNVRPSTLFDEHATKYQSYLLTHPTLTHVDGIFLSTLLRQQLMAAKVEEEVQVLKNQMRCTFDEEVARERMKTYGRLEFVDFVRSAMHQGFLNFEDEMDDLCAEAQCSKSEIAKSRYNASYETCATKIRSTRICWRCHGYGSWRLKNRKGGAG